MGRRDSIADIWGERTPFHGEGNWPTRIDDNTSAEPDRWVQSACVLCSNGCALDIGVKDGTIVGVRGRAVDHVNHGRLGPKGLHGWVANSSGDRLTRPLVRRDGILREATWDEAMSLIVAKTREIRERYTSSAIGFYTSGQLLLEEYYTLGVIGKAGLGTPHMDGNTRLCTATAAAALKETFGSDGQPGTYSDIDEADCILLVGHDMAQTATVLWMRLLDRRRGPNSLKLIVIDPRRTTAAVEADLHLAPRAGTNVAVLNGLLNLIIEAGHIDMPFIAAHTIGFEELQDTVAQWPVARAASISGVPIETLRSAADLIGTSKALLSTCLQGVYQANQATAAAVQVNNLNLIRGMIGRPGCGVLQMNGQPTAQNTRETGADGDLPGFRNWGNSDHIADLARIWNVKPAVIPHWAPPTHALQIFHYAESGSIRLLWISATNPAVSMPNLDRVRHILAKPELFVIVQDAFLTETAQLADVVIPAALWGEKTGTLTNADRTVHITYKAVEPPGEARSDLDIFLDYARRMDFRDQDGAPLIKWNDPEGAFEAWKECSRGRPCDYSGLSYEKLTGGSGISWPCDAAHPDGLRRIYQDFRFVTAPEDCETYGNDLLTGAAITAEQYRAKNPAGRAILKPADYVPADEQPDEEFPFALTTGRVVYHFHTRTKTGRSKELNAAAPDAFAEICRSDAERLSVTEGTMLRLRSRRGVIDLPARIGDIRAGHVFVPFHYGYWDHPDRARAANELTIFDWDPVSKQPHFKYAAVSISKLVDRPQPPPDAGGEREDEPNVLLAVGAAVSSAIQGVKHHQERAHAADYIGLLHLSEDRVARAFEKVREDHANVPDVPFECSLFARWSRDASEELKPFIEKYGERQEGEPERLEKALMKRHGKTGFGFLRDLHDLWLLVNESLISVTVLLQAAQALRDEDLQKVLHDIESKNNRQQSWLMTRIRQAAPQALVVPS